MKSQTFKSTSEEKTRQFAKAFAKQLKAGDVLFLNGNLGSGKTTFTKGLCEGLGIKKEEVKSPTFVLMHEYHGKFPVYHFDLYRLENESQLDELDTDLFFYGKGISIVEWADRVKTAKPKNCIEIQFQHTGENERLIQVSQAL